MANNIAMLTLATKIDNASINKTVNQLSNKLQTGINKAFDGLDKETQDLYSKAMESAQNGRLKNINLTTPYKELLHGITSSKNKDDLSANVRKFASTINALDNLARGRGKTGGMMPTLKSLDNSQMSRLMDSLSAEQKAKDARDNHTLNGKTAKDLYSETESKNVDELIKKYPKAAKEAEKFRKAFQKKDTTGLFNEDTSAIEQYSRLVGTLREMEKAAPNKNQKEYVSHGKEMESIFAKINDFEQHPGKYSSNPFLGDFLKEARYSESGLKNSDVYYQGRGLNSAKDYIDTINSGILKQAINKKDSLIRKLQEEIQKRNAKVAASYEKWQSEYSGGTGKSSIAKDSDNFKSAKITVEQYDAALKNLKETLEGFYSAYENGEDFDPAEMKGALDLYKSTGMEDSAWFRKYQEAYEDLAYGEEITPVKKIIGDYLPAGEVSSTEYGKVLSDAENMKSALGESKAEAESFKAQVEELNSELQKANSLVDELSKEKATEDSLNIEGSSARLEEESLEADKVKQAMDGASQAKTEFASANEKVRASAEQSSESLREESVEAENVKASTQESPSQSYGDFLKNQIKINPDAAKARQRAKQQELYDSKSSDNERYSSEAKAELKQRLEDEKKRLQIQEEVREAQEEVKKAEENAGKQALRERKASIRNNLDRELGSYQNLSNKYYSLKEKSLLGKTDNRDEAELLNIENQRAASLERINSLLFEGKKIGADTLRQEKQRQSIEDINEQSNRDLENVFSREALKRYNSKTNRVDVLKPGYKFVGDEFESLKSSASSASSLDDIRKLNEELDKTYDKYKRYNALAKGRIYEEDVSRDGLKDSIKKVAESDGSKILKLQQLTSSENGITKFVAEIRNADHELQKMYFTYDETISKISSTKASKGFERTGILGFIDQIKDKSSYLSAEFVSRFFDLGDIVGYVRQGVEKVKELDSAFIEMQKVSNDSTSSLKSFADQSFDTSKNIGTTAVDLQSSAADWMRIGESIDEASKSAEATSILKNVSEFDSIEDATSSLVSMSQAYSNLDKMDIVDKMNELGNNYAISTDELSKGLQDSASTLSLLGNSIDESAAIITAGNTIIQNVSSVAAGARTIALRLVGTEEAQEQLSEMGEATDDSFITQTSAKKRQIIMDYTKTASNGYKGFDILDNNGNYKNTYDILLGIAEIYKEIQADDKKFGTNRASALIEEMAGKNRSSILSAILANPDILKNAKESSENADGSAMAENEKYLGSIEAKMKALETQSEEFWSTFIASDTVKGIVDALTQVLNIITQIVNQAGVLPTVLGGIFAKFYKGNIFGEDGLLASFTDLTGSNKKNQPDLLGKKDTNLDVENPSFLDKLINNNDNEKISNIEGTADKITGVGTAAKEASESVKELSTAVENSGTSMASVETGAASAATGMAKFKAAATGVLSTLGKMALMMAAVWAVQKTVEVIRDAYKTNDELIEIGEESTNKITEAYDKYDKKVSSIKELGTQFASDSEEIKTADDAIKSLTESYANLHSGVDSGTNKNLSLSDSDYENYLDISKQLAEMFPSLVSGYDSEGNAILNLGSNAAAATEQLQSLMDAQRAIAHAEIAENINSSAEGVIAKDKKLSSQKKTINGKNGQISKINDKIKEYEDNYNKNLKKLKDNDIFTLPSFGEDNKKLAEILTQHGAQVTPGATTGVTYVSLKDVSDKQKAQIKEVLNGNYQEALEEMNSEKAEAIQQSSSLELQQKENWQSLVPSLTSYLQTSDSFSKMDSSIQDAITGNLGKLDLKELLGNWDNNAETMLYQEIISPLSSLSETAQSTLSSIFDFDKTKMSADEYTKNVNDILNRVFSKDTDRTKWKDILGVQDFTDEYNRQMNVVKENITGATNGLSDLSSEDMEIAYNLVVNDGYTGTIEDFSAKIKAAKEQADAETSNILNSHEGMDKIESLQSDDESTPDVGSTYDKYVSALSRGKELAENESYGTKEFKAIASTFSKSGADDAKNWNENLSKMERYFTEGTDGMENFMADMESKGLASWSDDGKWKTTFDDTTKGIEDAANSMGMSSETFLAMFDKIKETGGYADFFVDAEGGAETLGSLYGDLITAQTELNKLYTEDPKNKSAIKAKEEEISSLKERIDDASKSLSTLLDPNYIEEKNKEYKGTQKDVEKSLSAINNSSLWQNTNTSYGDKQRMWESTKAELSAAGLGDYISTAGLNKKGSLVMNMSESNERLDKYASVIKSNTDSNGKVVDSSKLLADLRTALPNFEKYIGKLSSDEEIQHFADNYNSGTWETSSTSQGNQEDNVQTIPEGISAVNEKMSSLVDALNANTIALGGKAPEETKTDDSKFKDSSSTSSPTSAPLSSKGYYNENHEIVSDFKSKTPETSSPEEMASAYNAVAKAADVANMSVEEFIKTYSEPLPEVEADIKVDTSELDEMKDDISDEDAEEKVVELIGEDNATPIVDNWDDLDAKDKDATLTGKDKATVVVNLWNALSAMDKYSTLTGQDKATAIIDLWNNMTPEEQKAILTADPKEAETIIQNVQARKVDDKNFDVKAKDSSTATINSIKSSLSGLKSKTITITTIKETITKSKKEPQFNGTFHAKGTLPARAKGTVSAYSTGTTSSKDVSIPHDETALINELGNEIVVRDGKALTFNNGYPTYAKLKRGDLVFNHKQTEDLERKGYITGSHAKIVGGSSAFATGTMNAYGAGTDRPKKTSSHSTSSTTKSTGKNSGKSTSKGGNTKKKKKSSSSSKKSAFDKRIEKFTNWIERMVDWIEKRFDRIDSKIELYTAKAELSTKSLKSTLSELNSAQKEAKKGETDSSKGAKRYSSELGTIKKKAISTGMLVTDKGKKGKSKKKVAAISKKKANKLIKKIKNGTIDISVLNKGEKEFVSQYEEYYKKYLDIKQSQVEYQQKQIDIEQDKLDAISEYYETIADLSSSYVDLYSSANEVIEARGGSEGLNSTHYKNLVNQKNYQSSIASTYGEEAKKYKSEMNKAKKIFGANSNEYKQAEAAYNGMLQKQNEAIVSYEELNKQLREAGYNLKQWAIDKFQRSLDRLSSYMDLITSDKSLTGKQRDKAKLDNLNGQIANNKELFNAKKKLRDSKQSDLMADIKSGKVKIDSTQYNERIAEIASMNSELSDIGVTINSLVDSMNQVVFDAFDSAQDKIDQRVSNLEYLLDMIGDADLVSDDGEITDAGYSSLLLYTEAIDSSKKKISNYLEGIKDIEDQFKAGIIDEETYNDKLKEYTDGIRTETKTIKGYRDSVLDIYESQLSAENDALNDLISKQKEALQNKKDYYDYDKTLKNKNKNISSIKAQIAALEGSTNASARAKLEQLKAQLNEAQEDYDDTVKNHELEVLSNGYDELSQDAQDAMDNILKALKNNSDLQQEQVDKLLSSIVGKYETAYSKIGKIIESTGVNKDILLAEDGSKNSSGTVSNNSTSSILDNEEKISSDASTAAGNTLSSPTLDSKSQDSMIEETEKAYNSASSTLNEAKKSTLSNVESEAQKTAEDARKRQEAEAQRKAQEEKAKKEAAEKAKKEKEKKISDLRKKLNSANEAYDKAWYNTEKHNAKMKKSSYWKYISDAKRKKIKAHDTISVSSLKKGKGLEGANHHNTYVLKEREAKATAQNYVNQLKKLGVSASISNPTKAAKNIIKKLGGFANGGQVDKIVPVETLSDLLPDVKNQIRSNKDDGLISAKIGEIVLPKTVSNNVVPEFISSMNTASNLLDNVKTKPHDINISVESPLVVNGSIDKEALPSLQEIIKKSCDYTTKEFKRELKKLGYK